MNKFKLPHIVLQAFLALASAAQGGNIMLTVYTQPKPGLPNYGTVTISVYDAGGELVGTPASLSYSSSGTPLTASFNLSGLTTSLTSNGQYSLSYSTTAGSPPTTTIYRTGLATLTMSSGYYTGTFPTFSQGEQFHAEANAPIGDPIKFSTSIDVNGADIYLGKNPNNSAVASFLWSSEFNGTKLRNFGSLNNVQIGASGPYYSSSWTWELTNNIADHDSGTEVVLMSLDKDGLTVKGSRVVTTNSLQFDTSPPLLLNKLAVGSGHTVSALFSAAAVGTANIATGVNTLAAGHFTTASGDNAAVFGLGSTAQGYNQFVIGEYNVLEGAGNLTNPTDPLFIIGNGTGSAPAQRSNAFIVERNGNTEVRGDLAIAPTGTNHQASLEFKGRGSGGEQYNAWIASLNSMLRAGPRFEILDSAVTNSGSYAVRINPQYDHTLELWDNSGHVNVNLNPMGDSYFNGGNLGVRTATPTAAAHVVGAATGDILKVTTSGGTNALRVTASGVILIKEQGDISMGSFTGGGPP